ncbi:MAG: cache domain-containing protein, partial [Dehalococcoidales bacterium]|nr:cache domain-containing protein [Dehalococcoidales bacterium]
MKLRLNIVSKTRFGRKLVLLGLAIVAAFVAMIMLYILPGMQKSLLASKEANLREEVQIAYSVISSAYRQETSGVLPRAKAQQLAIQNVKSLRYGEFNDGYFWINDFAAVMVMHPIMPELDGQDQSDFTDPDGKRIFADCAAIGANQGEGFYNYSWQY